MGLQIATMFNPLGLPAKPGRSVTHRPAVGIQMNNRRPLGLPVTGMTEPDGHSLGDIDHRLHPHRPACLRQVVRTQRRDQGGQHKEIGNGTSFEHEFSQYSLPPSPSQAHSGTPSRHLHLPTSPPECE